MTAASTAKPNRTEGRWIFGMAIVSLARMWIDRRWPESLASAVAHYAFTAWFLLWLGSKIWTGYRRRRPHWTVESWRRYLQLAVMPLAALVVFLALVYLNDVRPGVFGGSGSTVRLLFAGIDVALMLLGVVGFTMAIGWLVDGEPSKPFTRTRWFQRARRT